MLHSGYLTQRYPAEGFVSHIEKIESLIIYHTVPELLPLEVSQLFCDEMNRQKGRFLSIPTPRPLWVHEGSNQVKPGSMSCPDS